MRTVDGSGIEKARTMSNVIDIYDRFISGQVPELDEQDYLYPMERPWIMTDASKF